MQAGLEGWAAPSADWHFASIWLSSVNPTAAKVHGDGSTEEDEDGALLSRSVAPVPLNLRLLIIAGHGVQRVGMADKWVESFPKTCKPFMQELDHTLQTPLSRIIAEGPNSKLNATENSQPAIMAVSIMVLRILEQEFGFKTAETVGVSLGHSLGEFAALVAAGHLSYNDALRITRRRAEAMSRCTHEAREASNGSEFGMVALVCEPGRLTSMIETIEDFLGRSPFPPPATSDVDVERNVPAIREVMIANMNSKNQIVLSGEIKRINELLVQLRQFGGHDPRAVRLNSDSPFHSPIMASAKAVMDSMLAKTDVPYPGHFTCISNVSALPFKSSQDVKDLLARQCVETVRWWDSVKYADKELGVRRWIGLGPGKVGRNLVGKEVGMKGADKVRGGGVWGISRPEEIDDLLRGLEASETARGLEEAEMQNEAQG